MWKKIFWATPALLLVLTTACWAGLLGNDYNYITARQLKGWLENGKPVLIADIQVAEEFAAHHLKGAVETNAYPVKSDGDRHKIDPVLAAYRQTGRDIVVVCPRGKGGAKRCYDYLKASGITESHLTILEGGMGKWPFPELVAGH